MDFASHTSSAPWGLVTSAAARAKLRERADSLKPDNGAPVAEHLPVRPRRLRWSGRNRS